MSMSEVMLELAEEMVNPDEAILDDQIEDTIETEKDALAGVGEDDDDVIEFIANGNRLTNADPIDFTDDDVEETLQDDDSE